MDILPNLHDAVLAGVAIRWAEDRTSAELRLTLFARGHASVHVREVLSFSFDRSNPWGPSDVVNSAELKEHGAAASLRIEMQSGDTLRLTGRLVTVETDDLEEPNEPPRT